MGANPLTLPGFPRHRAVMETLSEYVKILRAARALTGLSQDELAQLSGLSRQIIVRIEAGAENVPMGAVDRLRHVLGDLGVYFIREGPGHGTGVALKRADESEPPRRQRRTAFKPQRVIKLPLKWPPRVAKDS